MKKIIGICSIALLSAVAVQAQSDTTKVQPQPQYDSLGSYALTQWHVKEYNRYEVEKEKLVKPIAENQRNLITSFLASKNVNMEDPSIVYMFKGTDVVVFKKKPDGSTLTSAGTADKPKPEKKDSKKKGQ